MNSETVVGFNENSEKKPVYFDLNTMPWETLTDEHVGATFKDLKMVLDERTGMRVNLSVYPAGYYKPKHIHSCAHGIYVISGTLKTDEGEFGPGAFVWYPEGTVMSHGATDREACVFLYIQDKAGELTYLE